MKKISLSILLVLLTIASYAQTWVSKATAPGGAKDRDAGFSFVIDGKVYIGGGFYNNDFHVYDPSSDNWEDKASIPSTLKSVSYANGFAANGKGYVAFGTEINPTTFKGTQRKAVYEYDPATDKWTQKADFPSLTRQSPGHFVINNKAYFVGGIDENGDRQKETWEYDPATDKWSQKADIPMENIYNTVGFALLGKGYVATGSTLKSSATVSEEIDVMYEYDPATDKWTQKANFPGGVRSNAVGFSILNTGFVGMGNKYVTPSYQYPNDFYAYNPYTDTWSTAITNFPAAPRSHLLAESVGSVAYIGTGWTFISGSNTYYNDWYEFSHPATVNNVSREGVVQCYPNPASDVIHLNVKESSGPYHYSIYNLMGKKVLNGTLPADHHIDISSLISGQYTLEVNTKGTVQRAKISILK